MTFPQPKWHLRVSHLSARSATETFRLEMDEMEVELRKLQAACQRLRGIVNRRGAEPYPPAPEVDQSLLAMDGWALSVVESYFALLKILKGNDALQQTMMRWSRDIYRFPCTHLDAKEDEKQRRTLEEERRREKNSGLPPLR